jgi:hypothetical protein
MGIRNRDSCREHFRKLKILPLYSQYILSLSLFVIHNKNYFKLNFEIYSISSRTKSNLHQPLPHLTTYQKETYSFRIKVFNSLPYQIKDFSYNIKLFKSTLISYLYSHLFYTIQQYFNYNKNQNP